MVLATDEVFTYAIFNYADMQWTSHTEAGGDTTGGEGGVPAFVSSNHHRFLHNIPCRTLAEIYGGGGGFDEDHPHPPSKKPTEHPPLNILANIKHFLAPSPPRLWSMRKIVTLRTFSMMLKLYYITLYYFRVPYIGGIQRWQRD